MQVSMSINSYWSTDTFMYVFSMATFVSSIEWLQHKTCMVPKP